MTELNVDAQRELPLSSTARGLLMAGTAATILLFYLFAALCIILLSALLAVEVVLAIVAARVALSGVVVRMMERHAAILSAFAKCFWLKNEVEYRIPLQPEDAPDLFALIEDLSHRLQVAPPRKVLLDLGLCAWVRLKGFRRGSGNMVLGIGYDLLAGLSVPELKAVLAHELTHARLVRRGLTRALNAGLTRSIKLAQALSLYVEGRRQAGQGPGMGRWLLCVAHGLAKMCARQVAACSRQEEFAADRGAAEMAGGWAIRSALIKLGQLEQITARIPWGERVARLSTSEGFSQWLVAELASGADAALEQKVEIFNQYATHPHLNDRLAVLPDDRGRQPDQPGTALRLLADPERTAEAMIREVQRVASLEEQKDSKQLRRWSRKTRSGSRVRPLQVVGMILAILSPIGALAAPDLGVSTPVVLLGMGVGIATGVALVFLGRYRERFQIPIPDYALLTKPLKDGEISEAKAEQIAAELKASIEGQKKKAQAAMLAEEILNALSRCDYLRVRVAASLCLERKQSIEALIGLAISAAALRQNQTMVFALQSLHKETAMRGHSVLWGAAWALVLGQEWAQAEAFLVEALASAPQNPTLLAMTALCQSHRGKLQSAIWNARQACAPEPLNAAYSKLLIGLLLDAGFLREAQERLKPLEKAASEDQDLAYIMVRIRLLLRDVAGADQWAGLPLSRESGAQCVRLGGLYETARLPQKAGQFYERALEKGFYPEALFGLGRLASLAKNYKQAQQYLLCALDLTRPFGLDSMGSGPLFQAICSHLWMLRDPIEQAEAWVARLSATVVPEALRNTSFLVYAPGRIAAEGELQTLLSAMRLGMPPLLEQDVRWTKAPRERQPDGPVRPGVQGVTV